jgi:hypothetical protein
MSSATLAVKGRRAAQSPWVERLARLGLVAKGVIYAVVAILAVKVALGGREESPDRHGALKAIAEQPFGKWLLTLLAIGLAGYALWRLTQAILDRDHEGDGAKGLAKRGGSLAKAIWYGALCAFTVSTLVGHESGDTEEAAATGVGVLGHLARMVVFALVALFLLKAAWEFDSKEARGLDGALLELSQAPYGGILLGAVAVGLFAYALYCFVQARYRRI